MKTASSIKQGYMAAWELMIVHICQECTVSLDKTWFSLGSVLPEWFVAFQLF